MQKQRESGVEASDCRMSEALHYVNRSECWRGLTGLSRSGASKMAFPSRSLGTRKRNWERESEKSWSIGDEKAKTGLGKPCLLAFDVGRRNWVEIDHVLPKGFSR